MGKQVLIVDDSVSMRELVSYTLKNEGFKVLTASNAREALSVLRDLEELALVITDFNMPGMDGIELIMELRSKEAYKFVPVMVLTTEAITELKERGAREGASGWLTKPFTPDVLIKNVGKLVR
jgi:two-component system chemotaxis response regulator CheY